jgi:phage anti-repressor protein
MNNNLELQEYLKKYSTINSTFINDFFSMYTIKTVADDFVIDLDNVAKWLNTLKKHLKKTLVESYQLNIDYKIITLTSSGKGRPMEQIVLTPSCFKRLCMMSRSPKAEEVRTYFIQLESHLDKYKTHIIDALQKKIYKYKTELQPIPKIKTSGVIYVLKTSETIENVYKLGKTQDFASRLKTHQSSHPDKLDIVFVYETDYINEVEACLKDLLKDKAYRRRKEFYEIDIELLKQLIKNCDCMNMVVRKKAKGVKDSECKYILHILKNMTSDKVLYDASNKNKK